MQVTCPHCTTHYVLLESLLGPQGARVRCPRCREPFMVSPSGIVTAARDGSETAAVAVVSSPGGEAAAETSGFDSARTGPAASADAIQPATATDDEPARVPVAIAAPHGTPETEASPEQIADAVLGEIAAHSGEAIAAAAAGGRLFAEFGAVIGDAYEFYRRRVGSVADPAPFRAALRARWGVDLDPPARGEPSRS